MRKTYLWASLAGAIILPTDCVADSAPDQIRGKSIVVSWTESRMQRRLGEETFQAKTVGQGLTVYVSGEGRLFSRRSSTGAGRRARYGSRDSVGERGSGKRGTVRVSTFKGHTLSVTTGLAQGARAIALTFDEGFSSCTANVIVAREAGAKMMRVRSLVSGETIEIQSASASGASCSIRNGNAFAN